MKWMLFLHVLGAILFFGNILVTAFWKVMADATRNLEIIHAGARKVLAADYVFTIPGLVLLIITGNYMAHRMGYAMNEVNWVSVSNGLFALTGVIWLAVLIPLQVRMVRYSKQSVEQGEITGAYQAASRYWMIFGSLATLIPLVILYLMTAKPF
ncbi:DUF2269 domain-containing protein [Xylanibacillus composti]|uniref:Membrane protein n=1 Tax=Xylanibacillus composti TaxID=1572762 RepID=A0A8J4H4J1_9BACL|nr:DUF2269 domain-containing protein [Xylanibacillus composti]MDT9724069.1 DUF2269 domain-containing protein [Xylanibacillus composti]GIQ69461.1 membrane protein [Xylanibacillus composti]